MHRFSRSFAIPRPEIVTTVNPRFFDERILSVGSTILRGASEIEEYDHPLTSELIEIGGVTDQSELILRSLTRSTNIFETGQGSPADWHFDLTKDLVVANQCPTEYLVGGTLKSLRDLLRKTKSDDFHLDRLQYGHSVQQRIAELLNKQGVLLDELRNNYDFETWSAEPFEVVRHYPIHVHRMPDLAGIAGTRAVAILYE